MEARDIEMRNAEPSTTLPPNERQDGKPDVDTDTTEPIDGSISVHGTANGSAVGASIEEENGHAALPKHSVRFYLAFGSLLLAIWLVAAELVVVASSLASISEDLGASSNDAYWVGTGYILAQTVSQPIYGSLSEVFGRKVMLQLSISIFLVATILCSRANSIHWLIGTRIVQGIGGGGITTLTVITVVDMTTVRERGKFFSYMSLPFLLGNIGILMGAAISQLSTWRWIFYMMIPICVISIIGIQIFLHQSLEKATLKERMTKLDWIGMITLIGSLTSFLLGLTSGGSTYAWSDGRVIAPLVIGAVGLVGFVLIERYVAVIPMLPLAIFKDHVAKIACFNSFCLGLGISAVIYYLVIYFLAVINHTLIVSGARLLPSVLCSLPGTIVCGILMSRMGTYQVPIWLGWCIAVAGMGAFTTLSPSTSSATQEGIQVLIAFGTGLLYPSISLAAQAVQPDELHSVAVNVITFFRSLGQTFGVALGSTVFQNQFNFYVNSYIAQGMLDPSSAVKGSDAESFALQIVTFPPEVRDIYRQVYSKALQKVWYVVLALDIASLLMSLFIRHRKLEHRLTSNQKFMDKAAEKLKEKGVVNVEGNGVNGTKGIANGEVHTTGGLVA